MAPQRELAQERPAPWHPDGAPRVGGCFAVFPEDRAARSRAAVGSPASTATAVGEARRGAYRPGLLALRAGPVAGGGGARAAVSRPTC